MKKNQDNGKIERNERKEEQIFLWQIKWDSCMLSPLWKLMPHLLSWVTLECLVKQASSCISSTCFPYYWQKKHFRTFRNQNKMRYPFERRESCYPSGKGRNIVHRLWNKRHLCDAVCKVYRKEEYSSWDQFSGWHVWKYRSFDEWNQKKTGHAVWSVTGQPVWRDFAWKNQLRRNETSRYSDAWRKSG